MQLLNDIKKNLLSKTLKKKLPNWSKKSLNFENN